MYPVLYLIFSTYLVTGTKISRKLQKLDRLKAKSVKSGNKKNETAV